MNRKTLLIIIIVIILALGAAAFYFFYMRGDHTKPVTLVQYSPGEAFVSNVYNTESLVKLGVVLTIREDDQERVAANNDLIRDTILRLIRSQEEDIYKQVDTMDQVAVMIQNQLNAALDRNMAAGSRPPTEFSTDGDDISGSGTIVKVYFCEFVMQ